MALTPEDKKDVSGAMGKALANKVSKVTRDKPVTGLNAWGQDAKTAKAERSRLRKDKSIKTFLKHSVERRNAGY